MPVPAALDHESVHPSRGGMPGETAFLTAWQDLMAAADADDEVEHPLHGAHGTYWSPDPEPDQDDATMAATLVQWLGTNAGACLVLLARQLAGGGLSGPDAFRAAWAVTNSRRRASNFDMRSIESMMVPPDAPRNLDGMPHRLPVISPRQYETAEHVCAWLGTTSGTAFLEAREREIEAFRAHEQVRLREANRSGRSATPGMSQQGIADYLRILRKATAASGAAA